MIKYVLAALVSATLVAATPVAATAQMAMPTQGKTDAKPDAKAEAKPEKKLTAQQQKMKDCAAKWQDEKKTKNVKGREAYRKFQSTCLKG